MDAELQTLTPKDDDVSLAQLRACVEVVACQCIGDEQAYMKNLKKQEVAGNADAQRLLAAWDWVLSVEAEIAQAVTSLRTLGRDNLAGVIEAVVALPTPRAITGDYWHMCSISGAVSAQTVAIPVPPRAPDGAGAAALHIDARFTFFAHALWIAAHFRDLERSRAFAFIPPPSASSIQDRIHAYLTDASGETAEAIPVYTKCVGYALSSLRAAIAHYAAEISEARTRTDFVSTSVPVPTPRAPRRARALSP